MQSRVNEPYVVAVATFGGVVYEVTNVGRVIALIDILRMRQLNSRRDSPTLRLMPDCGSDLFRRSCDVVDDTFVVIVHG